MDQLDFMFKLFSDVTGAKEAAGATEKLGISLGRVDEQIKKTEGHAKSMFAGLGTFGAVEGFDMLKEAVVGVYETLEKAVDKLYEFGAEAVRTAAASQRQEMSFKFMLGDEEGERALTYIEHISKFTEFTSAQLKGMGQQLLDAGFSAEKIPNALGAIADIAAFRGGGIENAMMAVQSLSRLNLSGQLDSRVLRQLRLSPEQVFLPIAKELGIGGTDKEKMAAVERQVQEGKVSRERMLGAVYDAIIGKDKGPLGTAAEAAGKTVDAQLKQLKALPERYMEALSKSQGFGTFGNFLGKILEALDPEGPQGKRIMAALERAFDRLMELFGGSGNAVDGIADGIAGMIGLVGDLIPVAVTLGKVLLSAAQSIADVINGVRLYMAITSGDKAGAQEILRDQMQSRLDRAKAQRELEELAAGRQKAAEAMVGGFAQGLASGDVNDIMLGFAQRVQAGFEKPMEIHSPSKVFERYGRYTIAGFVAGIDAAAASASDAVGSAAPVDGGPRLGPGAGGAVGRSVTINAPISVSVQGGGKDHEELAEEITRRIREKIPEDLADAAEQLATELGVDQA